MLSGALEEQNLRLAGGPADMSADTCIYLQGGARVRTHSLVLAAGSAYFRHLAQVGSEKSLKLTQGGATMKQNLILHSFKKKYYSMKFLKFYLVFEKVHVYSCTL
jgi:BTB/POZ domain